jgi:N-acetyl sugar amidotransferase
MDTSDPDICFDTTGLCVWCQRWDSFRMGIAPAPERLRTLEQKVDAAKLAHRNRPYDCIIGLSGGVDSSYVALLATELGLRPLAVHMDGGWNSEIAVANIEQIVRRLKIDLFTHVVDWEEMKDLQRAVFRAPIVNADIPQDHAFVAVLLRQAVRRRIKFVVTGANWASEYILPKAWRGHAANDLAYLKSVHSRFGSEPLRRYPQYGVQSYAFFRGTFGGEMFPILNYIDYDKEKAKRVIEDRLGWRDYGGKHYESQLTKFHQGYYLPRKLGYDKRRAHLANLVLNGSISREAALAALSVPPLQQTEARLLLEHVANKLDVEPQELDRWLSSPVQPDSCFRSMAQSLTVRCARVCGGSFYSRLAAFVEA